MSFSGQCHGEIKIWHWAHQGRRICDPWWENETEWHRSWKGQFPVDWQERIQHAISGEKHIADVKTDKNWVIEFQHSYLNPEERRSRNAFYEKLVWVVDGTRRKKDRLQFNNALKRGNPVSVKPLVLRVSPDDCTLLREWGEGSAPAFFDFGEASRLWWLLPKGPGGSMYVAAFSRTSFIDLHRSGATHDFEEFLRDFSSLISRYISHQNRVLNQPMPPPQFNRRTQRFRQYRAWRRF